MEVAKRILFSGDGFHDRGSRSGLRAAWSCVAAASRGSAAYRQTDSKAGKRWPISAATFMVYASSNQRSASCGAQSRLRLDKVLNESPALPIIGFSIHNSLDLLIDLSNGR